MTPLEPDRIPPELRALRQWVLWVSLPDKDGKKPRKLPKQTNDLDAKTNDPNTWTTFNAALDRHQRGGMAGIGFVFSVDDPFIGVDLDDCLTDAGTVKLWAAQILERIGPTYAEISPSGNGVKLWLRGKLPAGATGKKRSWHDGSVEVYQERRFFTVTGDQLDDAPSTIADGQTAMDWLWSTIIAPAKPSADERRIMDRARKYLARLPPAISGQNGHNATFYAACSLVLGFNLADSAAIELLHEYNERCDPPWSDAELQHKVRSASEQLGERGYLLGEAIAHETPVAAHEPMMTCLANIEPCAVDWLWPGRIPLGQIALLVGRPGEGKSFVTIDAAARISTGTPWPDGSDCPSGSVILMSVEDDPRKTIRPRLDAHGADARRVHLLSAVRWVDEAGQCERLITMADVGVIESALARLRDCKLIVVDPIGSFLGGRTDSHRDNEVRSVLAPIAALAEKYGPAVLIVAHRRKSGGSFADDTALGSRAFTGIARAVWHLSSDPGNKERRLLLPGKNNLARVGDGLAFSIIGDPARIAWERDAVAMSADDALAAENDRRDSKPGPDAGALESAISWLKVALADGARPAKELQEEWRDGHGGSKRTLERAKQTLAVEPFRREVPGHWFWRLPAKIAKCLALGDLGDLAENPKTVSVFNYDSHDVVKLRQLGDLASVTERNGQIEWPD